MSFLLSYPYRTYFTIINNTFFYTYIILQYFQYFFKIKLDGEIFDTVENENPQVFQNVKVLACSRDSTECHYGYPSAGASISSLVTQGKF